MMCDDQQCDCCERSATRILSTKTSQWCANWFIGYYCDVCYDGVEDAMKNETKETKRTQAREAWIKRYTGYFGEPFRLDEYRRGLLTFREFYTYMMNHADDMVNEAGHCDNEAFNDDE